MPEFTPRTLSHFALMRFTSDYYKQAREVRRDIHHRFIEDLRPAAKIVQLYQVFPAQANADFLVWSSQPNDNPGDAALFFERSACAMLPYRSLIEPVDILWGFTRPSQYTKTRSSQEIDPFSTQRKPYLVIYPFVKTAEWYLLSQESRQGIMNGHIKIGKQFPEIEQMLLYSFGVQNQEFVVVYETDDLTHFSDLVNEMRDTEARRHTLRDTPLHTAIYHPAEETLRLWR